jgi:mRNA interferase MazF
MKRGEVWWAELPPPGGRHPVVLVSRDEAYGVRELVTVVPVTTRVRDIPVEIPLGPDEGLSRRSVANADTITTIPKHLLRDYAGVLSADKVTQLDEAIRFALSLAP